MSSWVLLLAKVSFKDWSNMNSFSRVGMEVNKVGQNTVCQQNNDNEAVHINCVDLWLLNKVANQEANPYTWDVTASPVEELNRLRSHKLIGFPVNYLTVPASITIGNSGHVDIGVYIRPDQITQRPQEGLKDDVTAWRHLVTPAIRIAS